MAATFPASQSQTCDLSIPRYFKKLKDPRRRHRRLHLLSDIIVIALCAVIAGAQDGQDVEIFGRNRLAWLKRVLRLPHGIPSHDTLERVFDRLEPGVFQACFPGWVQAVQEALALQHIAIDGKTLCGSAAGGLGPLHVVSAWATAQRLSLGQVAVNEKSNEITAIPALLDLLELHGALVTIDAMGCLKKIAEQIIDQGGDYILTVKKNQEHLWEEGARRGLRSSGRRQVRDSQAGAGESMPGKGSQRLTTSVVAGQRLSSSAGIPR